MKTYPARPAPVIHQALQLLDSYLKWPGKLLGSPDAVKQYLRLMLQESEHEVFVVLFLDAKNRLIETEEMFRGTLTSTSASVYPREVLKAALKHNAASVIFSHNHPSGLADPSQADLLITRTLKEALALVDIRVLDHIIVARSETHSFAEHGQI
jgi:DNA repair protein RadC